MMVSTTLKGLLFHRAPFWHLGENAQTVPKSWTFNKANINRVLAKMWIIVPVTRPDGLGCVQGHAGVYHYSLLGGLISSLSVCLSLWLSWLEQNSYLTKYYRRKKLLYCTAVRCRFYTLNGMRYKFYIESRYIYSRYTFYIENESLLRFCM